MTPTSFHRSRIPRDFHLASLINLGPSRQITSALTPKILSSSSALQPNHFGLAQKKIPTPLGEFHIASILKNLALTRCQAFLILLAAGNSYLSLCSPLSTFVSRQIPSLSFRSSSLS
jgi:hypothetical protein